MIKKQGALAFVLLALTACSSNLQLPAESTSSTVVGKLDKTLYLRGDFTLWDAELSIVWKRRNLGFISPKPNL